MKEYSLYGKGKFMRTDVGSGQTEGQAWMACPCELHLLMVIKNCMLR